MAGHYVSPSYVALGYFVYDPSVDYNCMLGEIIENASQKLGVPVTYLMGTEFYLNSNADNLSADQSESGSDTIVFLNTNYRVKNKLNGFGKIDKSYPLLVGFFKEHDNLVEEPAQAHTVIGEMEKLADIMIRCILSDPNVNRTKDSGKEYSFVPAQFQLDRHMVGGYLEFNLEVLGCVTVPDPTP